MAPAGNEGRRNMVEAVRAATLTVHAAAGLTRGDQQAVRLLRAAEGLCRASLAVLLQPAAAPSPPPPTPTPANDAPRRRRRPRGKRSKGTLKDDEKEEDHDEPGAEEGAAATLVAAPGRPPPPAEAAAASRPVEEVPQIDDAWADQDMVEAAEPPAARLARVPRAGPYLVAGLERLRAAGKHEEAATLEAKLLEQNC